MKSNKQIKNKNKIKKFRKMKGGGINEDLFKSITEGSIDEVNSLLEKVDINVNDKDGYTPLHVACIKSHTEIAMVLIEKGADVNICDKNGCTPLHYECYFNGNTEVVMALIDQGADVNARDNDGVTPLHCACIKNHTEIAMVLINKDADVNAIDKNGNTPLHHALRKGHAEVAMAVIDQGADVNARDNNGNTPLHKAIKQDHTELAKAVIEKGAHIKEFSEDIETCPICTDHKKLIILPCSTSTANHSVCPECIMGLCTEQTFEYNYNTDESGIFNINLQTNRCPICRVTFDEKICKIAKSAKDTSVFASQSGGKT